VNSKCKALMALVKQESDFQHSHAVFLFSLPPGTQSSMPLLHPGGRASIKYLPQSYLTL
jgi:hypothetical protein